MAEEVGPSKGGGGPINEGCMDPLSIDYSPLYDAMCDDYVYGEPPTLDLGGVWSNGCCRYTTGAVTGCMDPLANNYQPTAVLQCNNCCQYGNQGGSGPGDAKEEPGGGNVIINPNGVGNGTEDPLDCSEQIFTVSPYGLLLSNGTNATEECCSYYASLGYTTNWNPAHHQCFVDQSITNNNTFCEDLILGNISELELENRVTCINCDNFAWWDNLYTTLNGASLQDINPNLWDYLINVITDTTETFGDGSFYVDSLTGEPIVDEQCCLALGDSNWVSFINDDGSEGSACLCDREQQTIEECLCIETIEDFISTASTPEGEQLLLQPQVLNDLGLSNEEIVFVSQNLFNDNDNDSNGIPDSTQARIIISNYLIDNSFYVCFQNSPNSNQTNYSNPSLPSLVKCTEIGGIPNGILCSCPQSQTCEISIDEIIWAELQSPFNETLYFATTAEEVNGISRECCEYLANEYDLPWVHADYYGESHCYIKDPEPCLPLEFKLNNHLITPECDTPLQLSVSLYLGKPENPCQETIIDDEIIEPVPSEDPCLLTFDENNNLIDYNSAFPSYESESKEQPIEGNRDPKNYCCYNTSTPIEVNMLLKDENNQVVFTSDSFSFIDVDTWFDLESEFTLPTTGNTSSGYNMFVQFTSGLNCCCTYDLYLDNFKFNCVEQQTIEEEINNICPGFKLTPVVDNKKSWVYNPGELNYSKIRNQNGTLTDNLIINKGDLGLIEGNGIINRTFAPSPDAELQWRYTDYFNQSSVLEKHSKLVLNSKELFLTFDMCSTCCLEYSPCPKGFTLSAGTETCFKTTIVKQFQDGWGFDFQDGIPYDFMDF